MIHSVVEQWVKNLLPMQAAGKLTAIYGLVRPGKVKVNGGKVFTVPLLHDVPATVDCETLENGLLLNYKERAVVFIEGDTARSLPRPGNHLRYEMPVTVVLWFNRMGYDAGGEPIGPLLTAELIRCLEGPVNSLSSPIKNVRFEKTGIEEGWKVFQKYTFREESGYLLPPYECVSITGILDFYLYEKEDCLHPLTILPLGSGC